MYTLSEKSIWSGRIDDPKDSSSYRYHQAVLVQPITDVIAKQSPSIAMISFDCEEGVRRNNGRLGAAKGSYEIKRSLASIPWGNQRIVDVGIVVCEGEELEVAQQELGEKVASLIQSGNKTIVLGGGHETVYGNYLGVRQAIGLDKKIGIINIDAHFDIRKFDQGPSSGTMFHQILKQDPNVGYLVLGIQRFGNTTELFNRADNLGIKYILEEDLICMRSEEIAQKIDAFSSVYDVVLFTLCMDVVAAEAAPGVSAPSPFGLQPIIVRQLIHHIMSHSKVISFDICEVNPALDIDGRTAKLGAYFVNEVIVRMTV